MWHRQHRPLSAISEACRPRKHHLTGGVHGDHLGHRHPVPRSSQAKPSGSTSGSTMLAAEREGRGSPNQRVSSTSFQKPLGGGTAIIYPVRPFHRGGGRKRSHSALRNPSGGRLGDTTRGVKGEGATIRSRGVFQSHILHVKRKGRGAQPKQKIGGKRRPANRKVGPLLSPTSSRTNLANFMSGVFLLSTVRAVDVIPRHQKILPQLTAQFLLGSHPRQPNNWHAQLGRLGCGRDHLLQLPIRCNPLQQGHLHLHLPSPVFPPPR